MIDTSPLFGEGQVSKEPQRESCGLEKNRTVLQVGINNQSSTYLRGMADEVAVMHSFVIQNLDLTSTRLFHTGSGIDTSLTRILEVANIAVGTDR